MGFEQGLILSAKIVTRMEESTFDFLLGEMHGVYLGILKNCKNVREW